MGRVPRARWGALLASSLLAAAFAHDAAAQTWTGAGADNNWSTGANWSGGIPPASAATTVVTFPSGIVKDTPVVDVPWTVNQINFTNQPYHLSGQAITLAGPGAAIAYTGGITGIQTVIDNGIVLTGPASISSGNNGMTLTGNISGTGPLSMGGSGLGVGFTGVGTYSGGTTVGIFFLGGTIPGPTTAIGPMTAGNGATNTGPLTVSPSASLSPRLINTGDLTIAGGLGSNIDGTAPGTQYGTVNVTGTVNVSGANLTLTGSYAPAAGDVFTLVTNDGADPVVGTFLSVTTIQGGLPIPTTGPFLEGAMIPFNGASLRLSYQGGTGNDITLTAISGATLGDLPQTPTLSEWALILLATVMMAFGMHAMRKR